MNYIDNINEALDYLPRKPLIACDRQQMIYSGSSGALYLVNSGRITVYRQQPDGEHTLFRLVGVEGLFGEGCLMRTPIPEYAMALERAYLMAWPRDEVIERIQKEPRLSAALLNYSLLESVKLQDRLQAAMNLPVLKRLICALLQLTDEFDRSKSDGLARLTSLSHRSLAEYTGTSRELVTLHMNKLRRDGLVRYSRKEIVIDVAAMQRALRDRPVKGVEQLRAASEASIGGLSY